MSRAINVDETNVTMKARTAWTLLIVTVIGVVSLTAYAANLSTKVDLSQHNISDGAHKIKLEHDSKSRPISTVVAQNHQLVSQHRDGLRALQDTVARNTLEIAGVRRSQYEQRAEDLAYRVIDALPAKTPRGTVQRKFESVKSRAMTNLNSGRDIRHGMSLSDF